MRDLFVGSWILLDLIELGISEFEIVGGKVIFFYGSFLFKLNCFLGYFDDE